MDTDTKKEPTPTLGALVRDCRDVKGPGQTRRAAKDARHTLDKINGKRRGRL